MRLVVASLLVAGAAEAGPAITPSRLEVVGDACPAALVRERVRAFVGTDPFVDDARVVVQTELVADGDAVRARLEVREGDEILGTRELAAPRCETLTDELALAIAMVLREVEPEAAEEGDDEPVAETREAATPDDEPPAPSRFAMLGGVELTAVVGAMFGVRLHVVPALSVGVELSLRADKTVAVALGRGEAHVGRGEGTFAGCWHAAAFAGCATATAGWVHGSGDGLAMTRAATTPMVAVGARAVFEWPVTRWLALRAHADLRAMLTHTRFTVDDNTVWTSPAVETMLGVAAVVPIP